MVHSVLRPPAEKQVVIKKGDSHKHSPVTSVVDLDQDRDFFTNLRPLNAELTTNNQERGFIKFICVLIVVLNGLRPAIRRMDSEIVQ